MTEYVRPDARAESILAAVALELGLSYPAIARALHCRNHTSAMYLVRAGTLPAA